MYIPCIFKNKFIRVCLDTGATISLITDVLVKEKWHDVKPYRGKVLDASGNQVEITGKLNVCIKTPDAEIWDEVLVI